MYFLLPVANNNVYENWLFCVLDGIILNELRAYNIIGNKSEPADVYII